MGDAWINLLAQKFDSSKLVPVAARREKPDRRQLAAPFRTMLPGLDHCKEMLELVDTKKAAKQDFDAFK